MDHSEVQGSSLARLALWDNIPAEMKAEPRWGIATLEIVDAVKGTRDKAPRNYRTHTLLSPDSDEGWATFDEVVASAPPSIGFRLSNSDPFVVIDLDYRLCTDDTLKRLFKQTLDIFEGASGDFKGTYIEYSQSTNMDELESASYHVLMKAETGDNRQSGPIQVFRRNHFIIMTGNVANKHPMRQDDGTLRDFMSRMPPSKLSVNSDAPIQLGPMINRDDVILQKMFDAQGSSNIDPSMTRGQRIKQLYLTDFRRLPESADVSSLEMEMAHAIVAHTQNREQFYRIFAASGLYRGDDGGKSGYRNKADYDDKYLIGYTFHTAMRAWQDRVMRDGAYSEALERILESARETYNAAKDDPRFLRDDRKKQPLPPIEIPPGLVGEIARFIFDYSPRPLWESAIAGALSLMATYTGRHYNINGAGLGLYILMVAGTGKGKETGPRGVAHLMSLVNEYIPIASEFLMGSSATSGSAAHRAMAAEYDVDRGLSMPSKLLFWGEAGKTLMNMAKREPSEHITMLKRFLLDAFSKGSWTSRIAAQVYAKTESRLAELKAPNLVILGDMTPSGLDTILNSENILDGFVPRLSIVEYRGKRPELQLDRETIAPAPDLVNRLCALVSNVLRKNEENICARVEMTPAARAAYQAYENEINERMDQMEIDESCPPGEREIWNRAGLKVVKLAGLIAVGCNHIAPMVEIEHLEWAKAFVDRDMQSMLDHMNRSSSLMSHEERMQMLIDVIETYFNSDREFKIAAGAQAWQVDSEVVGYGAIVSMISKKSAFVDNMQSDEAAPRTLDAVIDLSMRGLVHRGFLIEERMARYEHKHMLASTDSMRSEPLYRLNTRPSAMIKKSIPFNKGKEPDVAKQENEPD